jgi:hypothetical protein
MRRFPLFLLVAAAVGCGAAAPGADLTLAPTDADVTGTFNLQTSNGQLLPVNFVLNQVQVWSLVADQIVLAADNTWAETSTFVVTDVTTSVTTNTQSVVSGTYSITSGQINFIMTVGGSTNFSGSLTGNTLSLVLNGGRYVYSR